MKKYQTTKFMAEGSHYDKKAADYAVNFKAFEVGRAAGLAIA